MLGGIIKLGLIAAVMYGAYMMATKKENILKDLNIQEYVKDFLPENINLDQLSDYFAKMKDAEQEQEQE